MELLKHRQGELTIMSDKQVQKAGDNAQQLQAGTINVTNNIISGIDEKKAREIFNEMYTVARKEFTQEAYQCANERVTKFEEAFMPKVLNLEEALQKFSDPSFQFLITEAHKTAASTEREADYELLSELLLHRVKSDKDRKVYAGIKKAIGIVDQVDDDALCALTVAHAIGHLIPITGTIMHGLDVLENMFSKLCYTSLCKGEEWLDHLEILDAIRLTRFGSLKKLDLIYIERLDGYTCVGIKKESEDYYEALSLLSSCNLSPQLLCDHELLEGYVRLITTNKESLESINEQIGQSAEISDEQKSILEKIYDLYNKGEEQKKIVANNFSIEWKKRKTLNMLLEWWNDIPMAFNITSVGNVLAHANAQRCDNSIPPLE